MLGRFSTPDPARDPGWNLQLYGLGDPLNLHDPEGLGVVTWLARTFGGEKYNQFSDADLEDAYGSDKDVLMGMSYGARNALTLGFYSDIESPEEFAKRNGCRADTAAFAAAAIVTEFAADVALSVATGGAATAIKGGAAAVKTVRTVSKAFRAAQWTAGIVHASRGVANYAETGDTTQLIGAAVMIGGYGSGAVFRAASRHARQSARTLQVTHEQCFVAGTQVLAMDTGGSTTATNIEDIRVGDWVWSRNEETGEEGFKAVVQLFHNEADTLVQLTYTTQRTRARSASDGLAVGDGWTVENNNAANISTHTLTGTTEHPFWSLTRNAWVPMGKLQPGEMLLLAGGQTATATAVRTEHLATPVKVYNFEVADWHTYHVGAPETGWVYVHNLCKLYVQKDALGRPTAAVARIRPGDIGTGTRQSSAARNLVRQIGNTGDDAGHIAGSLLGGGGGTRRGNVFPQNAGINRGQYRVFEERVRDYVQANKVTAYTRWTFHYSGNSMRPTGFDVRVRFSDGQVWSPPRFPNP